MVYLPRKLEIIMAKHRTLLILSADEPPFLLNLTRKGIQPAQALKRAMILLDSTEPTRANPTIAHRQGVSHGLNHKLEFHFTPQQGSWLHRVALELSALSRQCLDRRRESEEALAQEVKAWEQVRNERGVKLAWTSTTTQARQTLKRHYDNLKPKN